MRRMYLASSSSNRGVCRIEINDTKAGMENIDKEKINAIIMKNTQSMATIWQLAGSISLMICILCSRFQVLSEAEDTRCWAEEKGRAEAVNLSQLEPFRDNCCPSWSRRARVLNPTVHLPGAFKSSRFLPFSGRKIPERTRENARLQSNTGPHRHGRFLRQRGNTWPAGIRRQAHRCWLRHYVGRCLIFVAAETDDSEFHLYSIQFQSQPPTT